MASTKYTLSDTYPYNKATVDDKDLVKGGDPVELTKDQVDRLEAAGVSVTSETSRSSSSSGSGSSSSSSSSND